MELIDEVIHSIKNKEPVSRQMIDKVLNHIIRIGANSVSVNYAFNALTRCRELVDELERIKLGWGVSSEILEKSYSDSIVAQLEMVKCFVQFNEWDIV